ncbi:MAG TPA: ribosome maturation factor RimM [Methylomirabilota bacterium]|jgi:16S rRNA processing protein RimM|nr:ribosome maturation factor RimM [Methylomirabilota bacterium]
MTTPLVAVGEVLRPHGLSGEVRVRPLTDRPEERFATLRDCVLWDEAVDRREACRIVSCRLEGGTLLIKVSGVDSHDQARRLAGRLLAVDRAQALPAPDGSFYPWQMEGARVQTRDGRVVGRFARIERASAQELWVIDDGERERLIPAVAEIVVEVNVAEQRIVIDPPDGLLEL